MIRIIIAKLGINTLYLLLLFPALFSLGGCNDQMNIPQSQFLSRFRIDKSVSNTAYKGIDYSGPGGSIGGITGGMGEKDTDLDYSSTTGFMIREEEANRFDENSFMEALKREVIKEIEASGASIIGSERPKIDEITIEYREVEIEGKVRIRGIRRGGYYTLKANIEEKGKR